MSTYRDSWSPIYSLILDFRNVLDQPITAALAVRKMPDALYRYVELGLDYLSVNEFKNRDPYTNWANIGETFASLTQAGWIVPLENERFQVTPEVRINMRDVILIGDQFLSSLNLLAASEQTRLADLLNRVVQECMNMPEPPRQWAIRHRFRVITDDTPLIGKIRERAMDLYAYRDDSHLAALSTYKVEGYVWNALTTLWKGDAHTAEGIAEKTAFRGYTSADYKHALDQLVERGWAE